MRGIKSVICAILLCLVGLQSCKTTEANYRAAYERATQVDDEAGVDETIYTQIRREMKQSKAIVDGDTLGVGTQYVKITADGGGINENIKRYCVVAGQFKQVFTARSMRERLVANGYPGAFVVETREPYYYVIAGSYNDLEQAKQMVDRLRADSNLKIKAPLPFLLNPAQLR